MIWTAPPPDPVDPPMTGAHRPMLEGYLDFQRATLLAICEGLSAEQLASAPLPSTNLTLLGLVRHLAKVERIWFRIRLDEPDLAPLFDPGLGRDADFERGTAADAQAAVAILRAEQATARAAAAAVAFDRTVPARDERWSLQMVYVHMIGEYARHNGHADLLREAIDGVTGR